MGTNAYLGIQAAVTRSALDRVLYSAVRAQKDVMCKRLNKRDGTDQIVMSSAMNRTERRLRRKRQAREHISRT